MVTLLLVTSLLCLLEPSLSLHDSLMVSVTGGLVQGTRYKGSVRFLGVPYGTAQRFQFPSPNVPTWSGVLNASHPAPQCLQRCPPVIRDLYCMPEYMMSENCLSLNVYRPAYNLPAGNTFPVMVFIHGGDFQSGSGAAPLYDGEFLTRIGGVIVITINYRLGALGFLPMFNQYDDLIGNFGIRDQEMALRWIQNNIAAFDGNPNKVTLFGAGAGCLSVALQMTSITAQSLFRSAILQSCPYTLPFRNKTEASRVVKGFSTALGCQDNDLACYREKSTNEILRAQDEAASLEPSSLFQFQAWAPIVDQWSAHDRHLLRELLQTNDRSASLSHKPVMLGFVEEEGRTSVYRNFPLPISSDYFQHLVQTEFPEKWREVTETPGAPYRPGANQDARVELVRLLNEYVYICPTRFVAQQLSSGRRDVWMYSFKPVVTWSPGGSAWPPGGESYCQDVTCHDLDLLYLFNPSTIPESRRDQIEPLSTAMAVYWTNFAKYGNPNGPIPSLSSGPAVQGSLVRAAQQFSQPTSASSFGSHTSRLSSLIRLVQVASSAPRQAAPSSPGPGQIWTGSSAMLLPTGTGLFSFSSPVVAPTVTTVTRPNLTPASPNLFWPPYIADKFNSPVVDQTLVLTQPSPFTGQSGYAQRCDFWDRIGYN